MIADNRPPLATTGLANLLNICSSNRSLEIWRRSQRFAAGVERVVNDTERLRRELNEFREALQCGDFGDLLGAAQHSSFVVGSRPFAGRSKNGQ